MIWTPFPSSTSPMRCFRHAAGATIALALAACDSTTPPEPALPETKVALAGTMGAMLAHVGSNGALRAECVANLTATATGRPQSSVRWQGGRMLWHLGMNRTTATDTTPIASADAVEAWGADHLRVGVPQATRYTFWAGAPFTVGLEFDYLEEATGATGTTRHMLTCGPTPPAGGAPAPVVRNVRVTEIFGDSTIGRVLPGRAFKVSYEAESDLGVWESGVLITGAFNAQVPNRNAVTGVRGGSVKASVEITVPADARVGEPFQIQGYAFDPFIQLGRASTAAPVQVVNNVPPVLRYAYFKTSIPPGMNSTRLVGNFAAGDTLHLHASALAARNPGWLVYTLGGGVSIRDSVPVPFAGGHIDVKIPVRAAWAGASSFSVQVVNDERAFSAAATSHPDSFQIVPARDYPVRSAAFATPATDMVLDETRGVLYIAFPYTGKVEILSLATMTSSSIQITTVPNNPAGVELTRGRDTLLVALPTEGEIAVLDLARPQVAPVRVPVLVDGVKLHVRNIHVAANGRVLVSGTLSGTHQRRVVEMTSSGGGQRTRSDAAGATTLVARSQDRGRVFFESDDHRCAFVYDSRTDQFGSCFSVEKYGSWSSTSSGSRFASGYDVFDLSGKIRSLPLVAGTALNYTTGLSPDGSHLYVGMSGGLARLRVSDGAYIDRIPLPATLEGRIFFAGPGQLVAVNARAGYPTDQTRIFVVDLP
ncbi:MAG: hypothetical protein KY444_04645 [Gemmatimonadetes bacterium]|nr:hypothetical protein [Gemmatimonadota bacterium]